MGIRIGLALPALALLAAVPAQAARDSFVRDSPGAAVATCLRPSGAPGVVGLLGPLERRMSPYDVLRVSADGAAVVATARLGILDECPAVAADPSGHTIVAGAVRTRRFGGVIRAALAEPGGGFGAPVDIARTRTSAMQVAAAVSPRGDAVVAWASSRFSARRQRLRGRMQVFAALRPAGGTFGPPSPLTPLRRSSFVPEAKVSAAMDASGTATVAWAQPIPDRRDIPSRSTVEVAAAPPGGSFGPPQVLARPVQHTTRVALSVAADGRALLAHDGQGTIRVYERAAGGSAFARVRRLSRDDWQRPEVALAPDGSALVSWRGGEAGGSEAVLVSSRRGDGAWTEPAAVQRRQGDDSSVAEFYGIVSQGGRPSPPPDAGNTGLRAAMGADGRYLVSWGVELPLPFGDRRLAARMVRGVAGGAPTRPETSGCPCRSVNGIVPLVTGRGEPLLAYTDNVTSVFAFDIEIPSRFGRLHLAVAGPPGLGPEPPRVTVRPPPPTTLGYANRLRVRVGCDRPCDLRAYVVGGRGRSRGMAVATLRRAGSMRLAIKPKEDRHLAPPSRGRAQVVVHGHAANGRRFVRRSVPVDLRRKPVRPLPRLIDVRAVRRGGGVVVTWRTDRPARRVQFEAVQRLSGRRGVPFTPKYMLGRGRRSFRVRLPGRPDSVAISVRRNRPPFDERTVVVKVSG